MRRPAKIVLLCAAAAGTTAALVLSRPAEPPPGTPPPAPGGSAVVVPAADVEGDAENAGDRDLAGARAAALRYLALSEEVVAMSDDEAAAAQRQAATGRAAERLVAELSARLAELRRAFPAGVAYRVGPLATRVVGAGPDAARVEIWHVGVVSPAGLAPWEEWRMARYDLAWERGGWRVAAESSGPGPRPRAPAGPEPVSAAGLKDALDGFTSVSTGR